MSDLERRLRRWTDANLIDAAAADRILRFEEESGKGRLRWPAILAVGFGTLMLCAGILLFVAAHWDDLSPLQRFALVLGMVAVFHLAASLLGEKVRAVGVALHVAGTGALGAGIYLAAQIFNLEEHWPTGIMLWGLGAVLAWLVLRQWPQALLAAVLIPWWLGSEWSLATEGYRGAWNIGAQGLLLLAILYISASPREPSRALRLGLVWVGALSLVPLIGDVMFSGAIEEFPGSGQALPVSFAVLGYAAAYLPALAIAVIARKRRSTAVGGGAGHAQPPGEPGAQPMALLVGRAGELRLLLLGHAREPQVVHQLRDGHLCLERHHLLLLGCARQAGPFHGVDPAGSDLPGWRLGAQPVARRPDRAGHRRSR
jgi:hypothetical protein